MHKLTTPLLVAAAATAVALASAPAMADRIPNEATGTTKLTLTKPTLNKLAGGGCGMPTVTPVDSNTVVKTTAKTVEVLFPVTRVVLKDNHVDAIQVQHDNSGIVLENSCYTVKLTSFRVQNFQDPDQTAALDIDARTKVDGDQQRVSMFTLDLSGAVSHTSDHRGNYTKQRMSSAGLMLAPGGAAELNQLMGASLTAPFSADDKLGSTKTQVKYAD